MTIKVKNWLTQKDKNAKVIKRFKVLNFAWECDYYGYLVLHKNIKKIVMTNHGNFYFANKKELKDLIREYESCLKETENILKEIQ